MSRVQCIYQNSVALFYLPPHENKQKKMQLKFALKYINRTILGRLRLNEFG